jgi:hypothetical protein
MHHSLVRPCKTCPFRADITPYLPIARVRGIVRSITDLDQTFSCHNTNTFDDDGGVAETRESQHCAGALIFRLRNEDYHGGMNQLTRIAYRLGLFDPDGLDMEAPVYTSLKEWEDAIRAVGIFRREISTESNDDEDGVYC